MTTTRNRGKESSDDKWFSLKWIPILKEAVDDLCFLSTRGYADNSALQIVGNRYKLNKRQRNAVIRMSCSDEQKRDRRNSELQPEDLAGKILEIDGFNLLIILESALSGGYIFKGRDGLYRDISSVHGSYKRVTKTEDAIRLIGHVLIELKVKSVKWYLDQPVSNSGRLKTKLLELSVIHDFNWSVDLEFDPDKVLAKSNNIVVSSDGWILDNAQSSFNLAGYLLGKHIKSASIIDV